MSTPKINEATKLRNPNGEFTFITIGEVIDTNDPQQMGRLRVACPLLGDLEDDTVSDVPWATYVSPLGGTTTTPSRGRGGDVTAGQVAYGMFNVPKVGTSVLVACIDADPKFRVWLGCVHDQFLTHTMPHGRYSYKTANKPEGPFSSTEDKIQPLYDSQTEAFTNPTTEVDPRMSFEFRTRAADNSVSGLGDEFVNNTESTISKMSDDVGVEYDDNPSGGKYIHTQGYEQSRIEDGESSNTGSIYDPQTYSWSTPGFHSMSMSDAAVNCRIRLRTTHGHQIIMDDTNERIYLSTADGKTWIELDEVGNIDIFGERNISVHAKKDINFTADGTFRVQAGEGIHMKTDGEMRISSGTELHLRSDTSMFLHAEDDSSIKVAGGTMYVETFADFDVKAGGAFVADAADGDASLLASSNVLLTGAQVHFNGPPAPPGSGAADTNTKESFAVSRLPDHEPWARTMTKEASADGDSGNVVEPEFGYDDDKVGREERGEALTRNPNWQR